MPQMIKDLPIGSRFFFAGDWQTEPSEWTITGPEDAGGFPCKSETGETSGFFGNTHVEPR